MWSTHSHIHTHTSYRYTQTHSQGIGEPGAIVGKTFGAAQWDWTRNHIVAIRASLPHSYASLNIITRRALIITRFKTKFIALEPVNKNEIGTESNVRDWNFKEN